MKISVLAFGLGKVWHYPPLSWKLMKFQVSTTNWDNWDMFLSYDFWEYVQSYQNPTYSEDIFHLPQLPNLRHLVLHEPSTLRPRLSHAMHQVRQHWHRFDACAFSDHRRTVNGKNLCGLIISDKNFLAGGLGDILRFPGRVISIVHVFLRKNAMWVGSVRYINM